MVKSIFDDSHTYIYAHICVVKTTATITSWYGGCDSKLLANLSSITEAE